MRNVSLGLQTALYVLYLEIYDDVDDDKDDDGDYDCGDDDMLIQSQAEYRRCRETLQSLPFRRSTYAQPAKGRPGPSELMF